ATGSRRSSASTTERARPASCPSSPSPETVASARTSLTLSNVCSIIHRALWFPAVLPVHAETIRLFLHVLAATIWVGGQFTLAGLVPGLRQLSPDAPRAVARRFNLIAWPAFAVLVITGIWNVSAASGVTHGRHGTTLAVK